MSFHEKLSVSVDDDKRRVRLSVKLNDDVVVVIESTMADFDLLVAQYQAAKQE